MENNKNHFKNFADSFLEKHQNQLFSEEQAGANLDTAIENSARLNTLCEHISAQMPELGLDEQQHEQLTALFEAFYIAGIGDGIDFTVAHSEPSLNLGAAFLTERYKRTKDGGKTHPHKLLAIDIAKEVTKERPSLKTSDIVRITYKRLKESVKTDEMPAEKTIRRWLDNA